MANQGTSRMPKRASDHIPYCKDQGIEFLCGATTAGLGMQHARLALPAGGIVDFEDEGLSVMEDGDYVVFAMNKSLTAPTVISDAGPFALVHNQTLTVAVDQTAVQTLTLQGTPATILSGAVETYDLGGPSTLLVAVDGGAPQTLPIAAARAEEDSDLQPFTVADAETITVDVDGGASRTATFAGTAAVITSGNAETYDFNGAGDVQLELTIDGGAGQVVTFDAAWRGAIVNPAAATAAEVVARINAEATDVTADVNVASVRLTSDTEGTGSSVHVTGGDANALLDFATTAATGTGNVHNLAAVSAAEAAALIHTAITGDGGESVGIAGRVHIYGAIYGTSGQLDIGGTARAALGLGVGPHAGTGDVANAAVATAAEVVIALNATLAGATADSPGGVDVAITSDTEGLASHIEVTGGTANTALDFAPGVVDGAGNVNTIAAVTATEVANLLETNIQGSTATVAAGIVQLSSATLGRAGFIQVTGGTANAVIDFPVLVEQGAGIQASVSNKTPAGCRISGPLPDDEIALLIIGRVHGMTA